MSQPADLIERRIHLSPALAKRLSEIAAAWNVSEDDVVDRALGRLFDEIGPEARDPDQSWFWSERWQRMEREVDEDIAAGRVRQFASGDDLVAYLRQRRGEQGAGG